MAHIRMCFSRRYACRTVKDIEGRRRKRFALYSLGNFISTRLHNMDDALIGVIVRLNIQKSSRGSVLLKGVEYIPTWVCIAKEGMFCRSSKRFVCPRAFMPGNDKSLIVCIKKGRSFADC
ncbi:hypothetical protein [Paenibacillus sp. MBLB4367]|uniref:hypothetical protein n=1 Tax=Paenibacillus sp. MBLB4367 TaxID=3384767 RepID=UPI003907FB72